MIFSPISEIPAIGRNPPYILTFGLFVILCVPTSLVDNFGGFLVLRFLLGFFGSPCLATGGASIGDLYTLLWVPFGLLGWTAFATGGPSLGPLISGFSVPAENWRWSQWELLWLSGPIFLLLVFCLPETSSPTILLRRAQRLRKLTGNPGLKSQSEIDQSKLSLGHVVVETLWRPMQINLLDPAVLFSSVYTSIVYGIYYSFFEVFPLVYVDLHGFNEGELGLVFLSVLVGLAIAMPIYGYYLNKVFQPEIRAAGGPGIPERRLIPGIYASFLPPIGLFMFGWTGVASIHWIVPTIGIVIYNIGEFGFFRELFLLLTASRGPHNNAVHLHLYSALVPPICGKYVCRQRPFQVVLCCRCHNVLERNVCESWDWTGMQSVGWTLRGLRGRHVCPLYLRRQAESKIEVHREVTSQRERGHAGLVHWDGN